MYLFVSPYSSKFAPKCDDKDSMKRFASIYKASIQVLQLVGH